MYAVSRRRGPTIIGFFVTLLVILLIVFLAVGWWRNWYDVSSRDADQELEFGMQIHKEEVGRDFGKLRDETQRLTESAEVAADLKTIEGTVAEFSPTELSVQVAEMQYPVMIDDVTEVYLADEETNLESVQVGDPVRVVYQESDGQKRASRITVLSEQ